MGLFGRRRDKDADTPPQDGCTCLEHVDDLRELRIPVADSWRDQVEQESLSVDELLDAEALGADPVPPGERIEPGLAWQVWVGDEARLLYDDDAHPLDEVLAAQPGIGRVVWEDREIFHVHAANLCAEGVLAAAARALADPRVR